jgi:hypothetical protein
MQAIHWHQEQEQGGNQLVEHEQYQLCLMFVMQHVIRNTKIWVKKCKVNTQTFSMLASAESHVNLSTNQGR